MAASKRLHRARYFVLECLPGMIVQAKFVKSFAAGIWQLHGYLHTLLSMETINDDSASHCLGNVSRHGEYLRHALYDRNVWI
jgi:hypothetical protein